MHSVETVSEVCHESNVKIVNDAKRKTWSKDKANFKKAISYETNSIRNLMTENCQFEINQPAYLPYISLLDFTKVKKFLVTQRNFF